MGSNFQLYIFAVYFLRQLTRTLTAVLFYGELTIRQSQYFSRLPEVVVVFTQWSIQKNSKDPVSLALQTLFDLNQGLL